MKPTNAPKVYVVLRRPRQTGPFLSLAKAILSAVSNAKTTFPTPTPPLTQLTNDVNAFSANTRSPISPAKRISRARRTSAA